MGLMMANAQDGGKESNREFAIKAVPVEIIAIKTRDVPVVVEAVGRLYPDREVTLSAQIPGEIHRYEADVGDTVREKQLLVTIKPVDYELALDEARSNLLAAEARLSAARKAYNRFKKLLPRNVISQNTFDTVESEYKTARAQQAQATAGVNIAEERLNKTRITAPFSSMVASRYVEVGQMIGANKPMMTLLDLRRVRVKVFLSEKDFVVLDRDDPAEIKIEAYPDRVFKGQIDRIDIKADPLTNTFGVEILVDNTNVLLKAGLSARVFLTTNMLKDIIMIPQSAVLFRNEGTEVFVAEPDETARICNVTLGQTKENLVQVISGLSEGDRLIVKGHNYVKDGSKIIVRQ